MRQHPARIPGSVATISTLSPGTSVSIVFFIFRTGPGHCNPQASTRIVLGFAAVVVWGCLSCHRRFRRAVLRRRRVVCFFIFVQDDGSGSSTIGLQSAGEVIYFFETVLDQDAVSKISSQPYGAEGVDWLVRRKFSNTVTYFIQWYIYCSGQ